MIGNDRRSVIYRNIQQGIWPVEGPEAKFKCVSSTHKGDVYKIETSDGIMLVRVNPDGKITWIS